VLLGVWFFLVTKFLKAYSKYTYWLCPRCGKALSKRVSSRIVQDVFSGVAAAV